MGAECVPLGKWLQARLDLLGWTGPQLARRMGVKPTVVYRYLAGQRTPDPPYCRLIAEALGVSADEVLAAAGHREPDAPLTSGEIISSVQDVQRVIDQRFGRIEEALGGGREVAIPIFNYAPADHRRWGVLEEREEQPVRVADWMVAGARAPFAIRVRGDCLLSLHIEDGDIIVCDRLAPGTSPRQGQVVFIRVGTEVAVKRWFRAGDVIELRDGDDLVAARLSIMDDFEVLGVRLLMIRQDGQH